MLNLLCKTCVNSCKQDESVKILNCPKFRKNPSENEFREMLDDLEAAEKNARNAHRRVRYIIAQTISEQTDESPEPPRQDEEIA